MKPMTSFKALSARARLVIVLFAVGALMSSCRAVWSGDVTHYGRLALLVFLGAVTAHIKVKLSKTSTLSLLTSIVMLSLMTDGIIAALAVGVTGVTVQAFLPSRKFIMHRFVFNAAMVVVAIHAASVPYYWVLSQQLGIAIVGELLGILAASLAYYFGNSVSMSLIVAATDSRSIFQVWSDHFLMAAPSFMSAGLVSFLVVEMVATTVLGAAIVLPVLYASYYLVKMAGRRAAANA